MGERPEKNWRDLADALRSVLAGQKVEDLDHDTRMALIIHDLIVREETKKPCKTCGTPRLDFSWWRVTSAGRMLVDAAESIERGDHLSRRGEDNGS